MLPRLLDLELLDSLSKAVDYNDLDHTATNQAFVGDLLAAGEFQGEILDLGTGTAQIPIELVRRHSDCYVMAVDRSISMLDIARYNVDIAMVTDRVQLDHADAERLPYEDERFAAIISNAAVHPLPEPFPALAEAVRVTEPGGLIFFRDFRRPEDTAALEHLVQAWAGHESQRQQQRFAECLCAALTVDEMRQMVQPLGFPGESVKATDDLFWTWTARKTRIEPTSDSNPQETGNMERIIDDEPRL
ncbi:MAG: class I SAM-dependent methyltransferase [Planctomycetaceae bacterium]|nr:MAG: class I SAM-dependent methyltransferase [Planctomycetaceae bacterium]